MRSKSREARQEQKGFWQSKLEQRLSVLSNRGIEPDRVAKDVTVRKLRARIREAEGRLRVIAGREEKMQEMARIKAEKAASPKKQKGKNKEKETGGAEQMSKRQQKKKKKKENKDKS